MQHRFLTIDADLTPVILALYSKKYAPKLYDQITQFGGVELNGKDLDQFAGLKSSEEEPKQKSNFFDNGLADLLKADNNESEDIEVNEKRDLYLYCRFDESFPDRLISYSSKNEKPIFPQPPIYSGPLEENEPLEFEDSWGKKYARPYSIAANSIATMVVLINEAESQSFVVEYWFKASNLEKAITFLSCKAKDSNEYLSISLDGTKLYFKKDIVAEGINIGNKWNHICVIGGQSLRVLINGVKIAESKQNVKELWKQKELAILSGSNIEMTEVRIWKRLLKESYIKQNMKCPLPILSDVINEYKMNNMQSKKLPTKVGKKANIAKIRMPI